MADKTLNCRGCGKYLGTIRNGSISRHLVPLCDSCHGVLMSAARDASEKSETARILNTMFGGGR